MILPAPQAPSLDPDWLHATATEVYTLAERLFSLGMDAQAARAERNTAQLIDLLDQRERVMRRIEPLLTPLALARSSMDARATSDPQLEQLLNEIAAWLQSTLSTTDELAGDLARDCSELNREIGRLDQGAHAAHAYRASGPERATLDLTR